MMCRIKILMVFGLLSLTASCSNTIEKLHHNPEWINLSVCMDNQIVAFDFSKQEVKTLGNRVYKFKFEQKKFVIQMDSMVSLPYKKINYSDDTLKIKLDDEMTLTLLSRKNLIPTNAAKNYFENRLFFHRMTDEKHIYPNNRFYLYFTSKGKVLLTDLNTETKDSTSFLFNYNIYNVDSLSILNFTDPPCNTFLIQNLNNDSTRLLKFRGNKFYASELVLMKNPGQAEVMQHNLVGY